MSNKQNPFVTTGIPKNPKTLSPNDFEEAKKAARIYKYQPMTNKLSEEVEARLKKWSEDPDRGLCADFTTEGFAYYDELKQFLADEIKQAEIRVAERFKNDSKSMLDVELIADSIINQTKGEK